MNKRGYNQHKHAKPAMYRRPWFILGTWVASFASVVLLYFAWRVLSADVTSFRSCNHSNGLMIANCGKASVNIGDIIMVGLFIACSLLTITLFTAGWRMLRRAA